MSAILRRLNLWEEAVGPLNELDKKDNLLIAKIGQVSLIFPLELDEKMQPNIGKRIGILHTDIPNKQYLFRVYPDQEVDRKDGA